MRRVLIALLLNLRLERLQGGSTGLDQVVSAKFDFNRSLAAILQMHHGVTLQTGILAIVTDLTAQRTCIDPKVAYCQILEKQSETFRIAHPIIQQNVQCAAGHGCVHEMPHGC